MSDENDKTAYQAYVETKRRRHKQTDPAKRKPLIVSKKSKKPAADTGSGKRDRMKSAGPKQSFEQTLLEHVNATGNPEVCVKHLALLGAERPVSKAIMSDRWLLKEVGDHIIGEVQKCLAAEPFEFGFQITRILVTPGNRAVIPAAEAPKARAFYEKAGLSGIASLRLCPVPQTSTVEPAIAMDVPALWWGTNARQKLEDRSRRSRLPDGMERSPVQWFDPDAIESLRSTIRSMLAAPFHRLPLNDPFYAESGPFNSDSPVGHRSLVTLMCRAQLPVRKGLMYFGGGKPIVAGALAKMDHLLKMRCKSAAEILHENEVPNFLFEELRRLGLDHIQVPVVKLR